MKFVGNPTGLHHYATEDILDVVLMLEEPLGVRFGEGDFIHVEIFGDLCELISSKVAGADSDDCSSQLALYGVRNTIASVQTIDRDVIGPSTLLQYLFPRNSRRRKMEEFQAEFYAFCCGNCRTGRLSIGL